MNIADLADKIRDRAEADSGAGGLRESGGTASVTAFYYGAVPPTVVMPYSVFTFAADTDRSAFTRNVSEVIFRVATVVPRTSQTITDPIQRGSNILGRIYGNSSASSLSPTYGFHRFKPTLTDWTGTGIVYNQTFEEHDEVAYQWIQEFKVFLSK